MRESLRCKVLDVCTKKIAQKGENVGVSFYAFFANKNDDPELLMEAGTWWIQTVMVRLTWMVFKPYNYHYL
ncbi:DUF6500 family protein [Vibrio aestuarianus]|uniref:DUF6500 family protein n=1 Tax=Vibrio aestuarianus TaxID=28171 RepID=UPI00237CAA55|nr:DUF6500 family protein [Vibrio aestuarianus]MDE1315713.1 DUF6500 family protein [Vibrio aestuarianus]